MNDLEKTSGEENERASLIRSLRELDRSALERFAWLGIYFDDVAIAPKMAMRLWGLTFSQAQSQLQDFEARALLDPAPAPPGRFNPADEASYRLRDLARQFARDLLTQSQAGPIAGLEIDEREAHSRLLERYRGDGPWRAVPDDGYILDHLVRHMERSAHPNAIFDLFAESNEQGRHGWCDRRERQGRILGFLEDLQTAWDLADRQFQESPNPESLANGLRCALIQTSIRDLNDKVSYELLITLAHHDVWPMSRILAYAMAGSDERRKGSTIRALAPQLSGELLDQALQTALTFGDPFYRAMALNALAPRLDEGPRRTYVLKQALQAALAIVDEQYRSLILVRLSTQLSGELLDQAVEGVLAIGDDNLRASTLGEAAPRLEEPKRSQALDQALQAASAISDPFFRALALGRLASQLEGPHRSRVLNQALETASAIDSEYSRASALSDLAPQLEGQQQSDVLKEALKIALTLDHPRFRASALSTLTRQLSGELLDQALKAALTIGDDDRRALALSELAPPLERPQRFYQALQAILALSRKNGYGSPVSKTAPLSGESLDQARQAALAIDHKFYRLLDLIDLTPRSERSQRHLLLNQALRTVSTYDSVYLRALFLSQSASRMEAGPRQRRVLAQALQEALAEDHEHFRATAFIDFAEASADILEDALQAVSAVSDEDDRVMALRESAPLSENLLDQARQAALAIGDRHLRTEALSALAPQFAVASPDWLVSVWPRSLRVSAQRTQVDLIEDIAALARLGRVWGGPDTTSGVRQAIEDIGRWWP